MNVKMDNRNSYILLHQQKEELDKDSEPLDHYPMLTMKKSSY